MNKLTKNDFSFKCPMNWDEMELSGGGRHCRKCARQVFDLTNCSLEEVSALQTKHGSICGAIRIAQVAAVAVSLSAAACHSGVTKTSGVTRMTGTPSQIQRNGKIQPPLMGEIAPVKQP